MAAAVRGDGDDGDVLAVVAEWVRADAGCGGGAVGYCEIAAVPFRIQRRAVATKGLRMACMVSVRAFACGRDGGKRGQVNKLIDYFRI